MKLAIDLQGAQSHAHGERGIGRYSLALSKHLLRLKSEDTIFTLNNHYQNTINPIIEKISSGISKNFYTYQYQTDLSQPLDLSSEIIKLFYSNLQPDILHFSSFFEGFHEVAHIPMQLSDLNCLTSTMLYDLIPLVFKSHYLQDVTFKKWYMKKLEQLHEFDLILSISEASRQDAINLLGICPKKIITIGGSVDDYFKVLEITSEEKRKLYKKFDINKPFLLYTGGFDFRKNMEGIVHAFGLLEDNINRNYHLVIVCSINPEQKNHLLKIGSKYGLNEANIKFTNFIAEEDLAKLYNLCHLFVFPSLYEGLGLPLIEAMKCNAPVITSSISSMPEIVNNKLALFNPSDYQSIANKITEVINSEPFRLKLIEHSKVQEKNFSWDKSAKIALNAFKNIFEEKNLKQISQLNLSLRKNLKQKIAYFSPLPPQQSGIANYSQELLHYLKASFEIDCFVNHADGNITAIKGVKIYNWRKFQELKNSYSAIIYHFGNSSFHAYMYPLLQSNPGIVVLHDFFISGLISWMDQLDEKKEIFLKELQYSHGQVGTNLLRKKGMTVIWDLPINRRIIENATQLVFHSKYALEKLKEFYFLNYSQKTNLINHIRKDKSADRNSVEEITALKKSLGFKKDQFIITSFGHLNHLKLCHLLIESFANSSLNSNNLIKLIFVGKLDVGSTYSDQINKSIKKLNLKNQILITGYVSDELYMQYLKISDFSIQLRTLSRGETSGTILHCLSIGVPVIINNHATFKDYSSEIVHKIEDNFSIEELTLALEMLYNNNKYRNELTAKGLEYIKNNHLPEAIVKQYEMVINNEINANNDKRNTFLKNIIHTINTINYTLPIENIANHIVANKYNAKLNKKVLIDVSYTAEHDYKTGISQVVRNITKNISLLTLNMTFDSCPIVCKNESIALPVKFMEELEISKFFDIKISSGDILLMLDLNFNYKDFTKIFENVYQNYGKVFTVVYDLLPLRIPAAFGLETSIKFKEWLDFMISNTNGLIAISKSVADEIIDYIEISKIQYRPNLKIGYFYLGTNHTIKNFLTKKTSLYLENIFTNKRIFLMVSTIEPRKGYDIALDAFDILWKNNHDVTLCIVGKSGWNVEHLISRIQKHKEFNVRLFWLNYASEEDLAFCYQHANALIFASLGEGFGLPLIEAAQYNLPIICSDLPVFKEIAKEHAAYFETGNSNMLANMIENIIQKNFPLIQSKNIQSLTWEKSAQKLLDIILKNHWYKEY